ncbi:ABC transporter ATP-binding protein [Paenibacillus vini]|uniref:ABC transporter ATP-binding protein n=1 Tax=Paenibacillus vini TaxID=1476024 RepID=UPI0025B64965|nr:ABC transporter ATP-binding protein [Paenibacillus vini]MDN4066512.1 ABC transporter ATP-binding protein [Paenibacillus vini]
MYAIEVSNLTKTYLIHDDKPKTLKEKVLRGSKKGPKKEQAVLENINIRIQRGQVVGIIGRNGSGKSTLLKLMSRIIYPTQGTITINGVVTSLLELGAGFHPDFTGLENIYMNASLFGLTKKQIDEKLNEIIEFSELDEYIYRPVRVYSSGMYMRLAFSIATIIEPDILLVDEVLAVGDAAFQQKCLNRIMELKERGKTIVIVAHDQSVVEKLCDYCIWLKNGCLIDEGMTKEIMIRYLADLNKQEDQRMQASEIETVLNNSSNEQNNQESTNEVKRWGNLRAKIAGIDIVDNVGNPKRAFNSNDYFEILIDYKIADVTISNDIDFGIGIFRSDGVCCYGTNTTIDKIDKINVVSVDQLGRVSIKFNVISLLPGKYWLDVAIHSRNGEPYDYIQRCLNFIIYSEIKDEGVIRIPHKWEHS